MRSLLLKNSIMKGDRTFKNGLLAVIQAATGITDVEPN